jgi:hypothetical protein
VSTYLFFSPSFLSVSSASCRAPAILFVPTSPPPLRLLRLPLTNALLFPQVIPPPNLAPPLEDAHQLDGRLPAQLAHGDVGAQPRFRLPEVARQRDEVCGRVEWVSNFFIFKEFVFCVWFLLKNILISNFSSFVVLLVVSRRCWWVISVVLVVGRCFSLLLYLR